MTVVRVPKKEHRKPVNLRRKKAIMMFVTEEEHARLSADAEKLGMARATYMRWRLLYGGEKP